MPKDKDRALNPAAQQRKQEKLKAVKKGKAAVAAQRTERLATRNPTRLESQIADLQSQREAQGGKLRPREQKQLEDLERDVARIKKAREAVGAPAFVKREGGNEGRERGEGRWGGGRGGASHLGKRRRDWGAQSGEESETTDEDVRRIPWPRDTPPPIPRRPDPRRERESAQPGPRENQAIDSQGSSKPDTTLPARPTAPPRTMYESKPQVRDLRKEATAKFMPSVVKRKIDAVKGRGGLIEEEELERLESEGYVLGSSNNAGASSGEQKVTEDAMLQPRGGDTDEDALRRLQEEEAAFEREIAEAGMADREAGMEVEQAEDRRLQPFIEEASDEDG